MRIVESRADAAQRAGRSVDDRTSTDVSPRIARVLALQRTVGNAVVSRTLADDVELTDLAGPSRPTGAAQPNSVEVAYPSARQPVEPPVRQQAPRPATWFQLYCCGVRRSPPTAAAPSGGQDGADRDWRDFLAEVKPELKRIDKDPKIKIDEATQTVLVAYDPQLLSDIYPVLEFVLKRQAKKLSDVFGETLESHGRKSTTTSGYWEDHDERRRQLGARAASAARRHADDPAPANPISGMNNASPLVALHALLGDSSGGFIIGEKHSEYAAWKMLVDHLDGLRDSGVRVIYLESIRAGEIQEWVDEYLRSSAQKMPSQLEAFVLKYKSRWNHDGLRNLLDAVKRMGGMRIHAIDSTTAARKGAGDKSLHERAALMNAFATERVREDQTRDPGRYVALVGEAHAVQHDFTGDRGDLPAIVPGLTRYLGVPAVRISGPHDAQTVEALE
ncbi:hypothetical protein GCM10027271_12030 [Saccharopolyspora gloriosae]|uniref:Uncharacterized protein n=1 Tax=Saccharopolyspora gloriosae TaxID=455344 RepID=A0A840NU60_9PSEU|nr:hypothetical protein [Saccharopolyspora gloriosae]MBB5072742.1 hypothetical protein [Saccharopolyspora gloriosae]